MQNQVLDSTRELYENMRYVKVDEEAIGITAREYADNGVSLSSWRDDEFLEGSYEDTIDFLMIGSAIDLRYENHDIDETSRPNDTAMCVEKSMWACLRDAHLQGMGILEGRVLKDLTLEQMAQIFDGSTGIPRLQEKQKILNELGCILTWKYEGHFWNLFDKAGYRLFDRGNGIVDRLIEDFPSFRDSGKENGRELYFNSKAQKGPVMIYGRFNSQKDKIFPDANLLTASSGCNLILVQAFKKIVQISDDVRAFLKEGQGIPDRYRLLNELRAAGIHNTHKLCQLYNKMTGEDIMDIHIDAKQCTIRDSSEYKAWLKDNSSLQCLFG